MKNKKLGGPYRSVYGPLSPLATLSTTGIVILAGSLILIFSMFFLISDHGLLQPKNYPTLREFKALGEGSITNSSSFAEKNMAASRLAFETSQPHLSFQGLNRLDGCGLFSETSGLTTTVVKSCTLYYQAYYSSSYSPEAVANSLMRRFEQNGLILKDAFSAKDKSGKSITCGDVHLETSRGYIDNMSQVTIALPDSGVSYPSCDSLEELTAKTKQLSSASLLTGFDKRFITLREQTPLEPKALTSRLLASNPQTIVVAYWKYEYFSETPPEK